MYVHFRTLMGIEGSCTFSLTLNSLAYLATANKLLQHSVENIPSHSYPPSPSPLVQTWKPINLILDVSHM